MNVSGFQHVRFRHVGFQLATQALFAKRMVRDFQPWRISANTCAATYTSGAKSYTHLSTWSCHTAACGAWSRYVFL